MMAQCAVGLQSWRSGISNFACCAECRHEVFVRCCVCIELQVCIWVFQRLCNNFQQEVQVMYLWAENSMGSHTRLGRLGDDYSLAAKAKAVALDGDAQCSAAHADRVARKSR